MKICPSCFLSMIAFAKMRADCRKKEKNFMRKGKKKVPKNSYLAIYSPHRTFSSENGDGTHFVICVIALFTKQQLPPGRILLIPNLEGYLRSKLKPLSVPNKLMHTSSNFVA